MPRAPERAWSEIGAFLERDLRILSPERRRRLHGDWSEISRLEAEIDDRLAVGLVGGTGVGKSTIINALAEAEISAVGERRPTTDCVIAYRHEKTPLAEGIPRESLATPEVVHQKPALEGVVIVDFADFDSVESLHRETLRRFLPHLDILLVVVDDMKYGDARLFELLRGVSQSRENLYPVLNKIDRLRLRYGERTDGVVGEIVGDLCEKLEAHAGIRLSSERVFAISARSAFLGETGAGKFGALVELLESYRFEKRRRAAKELNLEARKASLRSELGRISGETEHRTRAERLVDMGAARLEDLRWAFGGIDPSILSGRERRQIAASAARRGGKLGFPLDLLLSLFREMRPPAAAEEIPVRLDGSRILQHYGAYVQGVENIGQEVEIESGDWIRAGRAASEPSSPDGGRGGLGRDLSALGEDLERSLRALAASAASRSWLRRHGLPLGVMAVFAWWIAYPAFEESVRRLFGKEGASWGGAMESLVFGLLRGLHPLALGALATSVVVAYAGTALLLRVGFRQRVDRALAEIEGAARRRIEEWGERAVAESIAPVRAWLAEREELERLLEP